MPYVKRDASGRISALFAHPAGEATEEVSEHDAELARFLLDARLARSALMDWVQSDLGMARVVEDLIELLIENGTIRFDQLPVGAQQKLVQRSGLRRERRSLDSLFDASDPDLASAEEVDDSERYL